MPAGEAVLRFRHAGAYMYISSISMISEFRRHYAHFSTGVPAELLLPVQ